MELTGKIHHVFDAKQVTAKFRKREFVLETADDPRNLQYISMELVGDRCESIDDFELSAGAVTVTFQMKGRMWESPKGELRCFSAPHVLGIKSASTAPFKAPAGSADDDDIGF